MDGNNNNNNNNKERFSPSLFLAMLKEKFLFVVSGIDYVIPVFSFFRYCIQRFACFFEWFTEPRGYADEIFFRVGLVFRAIVALFIFWLCFSVWRLLNGFMWNPILGAFVTSPLDHYFRGFNGEKAVNLVDYLFLVERYAEPLGVYNTYNLPVDSGAKTSPTYWQHVYKLNKKTLDWRPSAVPLSEILAEGKRMFLYMWNHKYPEYPSPMRYLSLFYKIDRSFLSNYFNVLQYDDMTIDLSSFRLIVDIPFIKEILAPHVKNHRVSEYYIQGSPFYWINFYCYKHGYVSNPLTVYLSSLNDAEFMIKDYWDWVVPRIPEYIVKGLPDEWYIRHESYENIGKYPEWNYTVNQPIRQVYHRVAVAPVEHFRLERRAYFTNFFPDLPAWGPGKVAIKTLLSDMFELFWFRYCAPTASFKLFARFSDDLVLFHDFGKYLVYFVTVIYGIPFLLVTYTSFFASYFFTPFRIVVTEVVMRIIDGVFSNFLDFAVVCENYYRSPTAFNSEADMYNLLSTFWMLFAIIPFLYLMIVLPIYLIVGLVMMLVIRPCLLAYRLFIDFETDTLRTRDELYALWGEQLGVLRGIFSFRVFRLLYSLKSFLSKVHYHTPPVLILPRRWRRKGFMASFRWYFFHSKTTAVVAWKDLQQFKADTLLIKEKGEEAYQKELDIRYWRVKAAFAASWEKHSFITNDWLANRHLFFCFSWVGNIVVFVFIVFWCLSVTYKKVLFLQLFSDALFPNGLPPLYMGTAAYPKSTAYGIPDLDDHRWELWATFTDLENMFYSAQDQGTHIDHYAEFIFVISKWFLIHFTFFIVVCGVILLCYRGPRYIIMTYIAEVLLSSWIYIFGMGWAAYAFAGGFPEWDLLGFRGFLNSLMFGEEWLFDNYLTGYFGDDLVVMDLEKYVSTHWMFKRDWSDIYKYRNYHVRRYRKRYMRLYTPIEEVLYPVGEFIEIFRDVYWKEQLEKWEPEITKLRHIFWNEGREEEVYEDEYDEGIHVLKERPKTGAAKNSTTKK
jgi:hypothetical protein